MVSVAKSFDAPIKLLFPTADAARPFSMLGLGDIVIPGIFVALALRFDVSRGIKNRYFNSAFLGYTEGDLLYVGSAVVLLVEEEEGVFLGASCCNWWWSAVLCCCSFASAAADWRKESC